MMREFILLAFLVAFSCCQAAPVSHQEQLSSDQHKEQSIPLYRPSPINPDIPSDPKPADKITMITDPTEIVKHKRQTADDPYYHISHFAPTKAPIKKENGKEHSQESQSTETNTSHHRQKREQGGHIIDAKKPLKAPAVSPTRPHKTAAKKDKPNQKRYNNAPATVTATKPAHDSPKVRQRRQVDPHLIGAATVGVGPLILNDDIEKKPEDTEVIVENAHQEAQVLGVQHSEDQIPENTDSHADAPAKRDIPVPLVPKYHHPEESPKGGESLQKKDGHKADESSESDESDEDSQENKPLSTHLPVQPTVNAHVANNNQQKFPIQHSPLEGSNVGPIEHVTSFLESEKDQHHQLIQPAVHPQVTNYSQPPASTLLLQEHAKPLGDQEKPSTSTENKPLEDELATIKPSQVIAYEPQSHDEHLAIKNPVPVAELFSKPKE